jgi:hypothetical protein
MSSLFLLVHYVDVFRNLFVYLGAIIFYVYLGVILIWLMAIAAVQTLEDDADEAKEGLYAVHKLFTKYVLIFFFMYLTGLAIPSKKTIITYYCIKQVEIYNKNNKDSNLKPQQIIKNTDSVINDVMGLFDKVKGKVNKLTE